jgi:WD40 repeat protein
VYKAEHNLFLCPGGYAHDESVTCLDVNEDNTILASGSEDGVLKLTHIGNGKVNSYTLSTLVLVWQLAVYWFDYLRYFFDIKQVLGNMEAALTKKESDVSIEAVGFCSK